MKCRICNKPRKEQGYCLTHVTLITKDPIMRGLASIAENTRGDETTFFCPYCGVTVVLPDEEQILKCPFCGYNADSPEARLPHYDYDFSEFLGGEKPFENEEEN